MNNDNLLRDDETLKELAIILGIKFFALQELMTDSHSQNLENQASIDAAGKKQSDIIAWLIDRGENKYWIIRSAFVIRFLLALGNITTVAFTYLLPKLVPTIIFYAHLAMIMTLFIGIIVELLHAEQLKTIRFNLYDKIIPHLPNASNCDENGSIRSLLLIDNFHILIAYLKAILFFFACFFAASLNLPLVFTLLFFIEIVNTLSAFISIAAQQKNKWTSIPLVCWELLHL